MISGGMVMDAAFLVFRAAVCSFLAFAGGYWIITSWIDRRLSALEAGGLLAALVVAMFVIIAYAVRQSLVVLVMLVLVAGALAVTLTAYSKAADRRLHRRFDEEDIAKYLEALDLDPKNVAAHSLLADVYRRQGRLEEALAEYEAAVRLSPDLPQERFWVDRLRAMIDRKQHGLDLHGKPEVLETPCPACGALVGAKEANCPECGQHVGLR